MESKPIVSISGKKGPFENTKQALSQLDLSKMKGKTVLIKPNVGRAAKPEQGYNTHPKTIAALIEVLNDVGVSKIVIGESPLVGIKTLEAFEKAGITEVANKYGIDLIDFDSVKPITKEIPEPRILKSTRICAPVFDYDFLISVPVAKTHMHTGVTLGIKNLKGCLYRHEKVKYHQLEYINKVYQEKTLDSGISDLAMILLPDLTVLDGYIGMEGLGPSGGEAIKSDFALASWHPLAADIYGCILIGIDPNSVPHIRLVGERRKLSMNPDSYTVTPANWEEFVHPYKRPPEEISLKFKNVCVQDKESCSSCLSTLMLFLKRFKDDMGDYLLDDGKFHIGIGKGITDPKEGMVFVGNCAKKMSVDGIFIPGCPPVPTRIYEAITGSEPEENEPEVS